MNEYTEARQDLEAAARLNPNLPGVSTELGIAKESAGDLDGAENDLRRALELDVIATIRLMYIGRDRFEKRDLEAAKTFIQRALKIDPDAFFGVYEMALVKSASGQVDAAVADLERVVRGDPKWLEPHIQLAALYYKLHRPTDGLRERQTVHGLPRPSRNTSRVSFRIRNYT